MVPLNLIGLSEKDLQTVENYFAREADNLGFEFELILRNPSPSLGDLAEDENSVLGVWISEDCPLENKYHLIYHLNSLLLPLLQRASMFKGTPSIVIGAQEKTPQHKFLSAALNGHFNVASSLESFVSTLAGLMKSLNELKNLRGRLEKAEVYAGNWKRKVTGLPSSRDLSRCTCSARNCKGIILASSRGTVSNCKGRCGCIPCSLLRT